MCDGECSLSLSSLVLTLLPRLLPQLQLSVGKRSRSPVSDPLRSFMTWRTRFKLIHNAFHCSEAEQSTWPKVSLYACTMSISQLFWRSFYHILRPGCGELLTLSHKNTSKVDHWCLVMRSELCADQPKSSTPNSLLMHFDLCMGAFS